MLSDSVTINVNVRVKRLFLVTAKIAETLKLWKLNIFFNNTFM